MIFRLLLLNIRGATSFKDLLKIENKNEYYNNFTEACLGHGLIFNDQEWIDCMKEAIMFKMPSALRTLFAMILVHGAPALPTKLWEQFKLDLSEDFIYNGMKENEAFNKALSIIANKVDSIGWQGNKYKDLNMPKCIQIDENENLRVDPIQSN